MVLASRVPPALRSGPLGAGAFLEVQLVGAHDAGHHLDCGLHVAVARGLVRVRVLFNDLVQLGDHDPRLSDGVLQQLQDGRLVVGAQAYLLAAQPIDIRSFIKMSTA